MNATETARLLAICAATFPQYPITKETVSVYAEMLADVPYDHAERGLRDLLMTTDRWPSIAAIRRKVAERMGTLAPEKALAWAEVRAQITAVGRQGSPNFSHPVIREAVRTFGWWELCMSENLETTRAQFWRVYDELQTNHDRQAITGIGFGPAAIEAQDAALALEG